MIFEIQILTIHITEFLQDSSSVFITYIQTPKFLCNKTIPTQKLFSERKKKICYIIFPMPPLLFYTSQVWTSKWKQSGWFYDQDPAESGPSQPCHAGNSLVILRHWLQPITPGPLAGDLCDVMGPRDGFITRAELHLRTGTVLLLRNGHKILSLCNSQLFIM